MHLKQNLETAVAKIIKAFEKKQDMELQFWVSDDVTGVACFGDVLYFNLSDICFDIFTNQPKHRIVDWLECCLENEKYQNLNYQTFCKTLKTTEEKLNDRTRKRPNLKRA